MSVQTKLRAIMACGLVGLCLAFSPIQTRAIPAPPPGFGPDIGVGEFDHGVGSLSIELYDLGNVAGSIFATFCLDAV